MKRWLFAIVMAAVFLTGCGSSASEKTMATLAEGDTAVSASAASPEMTAGSQMQTVVFGKYKNQDIDWYILTEDDQKTFLLSVHAIDTRPFSESPACWDQSSLRAWLNDDFYREAFRAEEQEKILLTKSDNGDDLHYGTRAGENTEDHVFLLSASEARKYLNREETVTTPTEYAAEQGAYMNENGNCAWWLRSPGIHDDGPAYYSSQGDIGTREHKGSENIIGVRPAIWVDLSALK